MSDNTQAAHEAAYRKAVDASRGAGTFAEERRTFAAIYHAEMMRHERPAIEAQAREAALREAAEVVDCDCPFRDQVKVKAIECEDIGCGARASNAVLALIQKEPTNAG